MEKGDVLNIAIPSVIAFLGGAAGARLLEGLFNRHKNKAEVTVTITEAASEIINALRQELADTRADRKADRLEFEETVASLRADLQIMKDRLDACIASHTK